MKTQCVLSINYLNPFPPKKNGAQLARDVCIPRCVCVRERDVEWVGPASLLSPWGQLGYPSRKSSTGAFLLPAGLTSPALVSPYFTRGPQRI